MQDQTALQAMAEMNITPTLLVALPLYHAYGLVGMLCIGTLVGYTIVLMSKFDPHVFLDSIQKYKVYASSLICCFNLTYVFVLVFDCLPSGFGVAL